MLTPETLPRLQQMLADEKIDGWLLFDFRGVNGIAGGVLRLDGMVTRRVFAFIPRSGDPVAVTHAIEQGPWHRWPSTWRREVYSSWRSLEKILRDLVRGKRVAMEYSPGDAVPYLDRVPAGVLEMVRDAGGEVVSSAPLVTSFYAAWNADHLAAHKRAAKTIAEIARQAIQFAAERADSTAPATEHELAGWITDQFARWGLETHDIPIVAVDENSANPHYEPSAAHRREITRGSVLMIDLWAHEHGGAYADQTWMASLGEPSKRTIEVWTAVRDARDAAIALVKSRIESGTPLRAQEVDDAARQLIEQRGFGQYFVHRTGHSIDPHELHGAGPHLDNLETRDDRLLVPGVGFSIEPGVYLPGKIGVRSEVNAYIGEREVVITPAEYQRELAVV